MLTCLRLNAVYCDDIVYSGHDYSDILMTVDELNSACIHSMFNGFIFKVWNILHTFYIDS